MLACLSVAPCDAHRIILEEVDYVLNKKGGEGCVREFIEELLDFKSMPKNQLNKLLN